MKRPSLTESEVVKAIRKQREEIARNELDTLRRMARLWVPSYRYLQEQVSALMRIIQDKQDKGDPVEMEYIYSLKRYQTMMEQAAVTIRKYNKAIAGLINGAEAEATDLGQSNASSVISIAEPDHELWTRVNRRETTIAAGMTAEGSPLDSLLEKSFGQMKEGMEQALITGISTGQGSAWIADQIMQAAQIPERRALLIARTEVNRAYRQSNWNQMRGSRAVLGYRRMCYPDTACFACLMLDKEFYPIDSEPRDHPNGKCSFVPVTRHYDPGNDPGWQGGREYFDSLPEDAQRKLMGPGRFDLWKQGGVDPRDMVYIKPNQTWGGSPAVRTLESIKMEMRPRFVSAPAVRDMANGLRQSPFRILNEQEIESLREDIQAIGADESVFRFNYGTRTAYHDDDDFISVRGDVLPDPYSNKARDKMSSRAALAHEYHGHRANRNTPLPSGSWNDEFRASYMAAKNSPGLSTEDRYYLIQDAIDRAQEAGVKIRYNSFMQEVLYGGIYK